MITNWEMCPNFQLYGCELMKLPSLQKRHLKKAVCHSSLKD